MSTVLPPAAALLLLPLLPLLLPLLLQPAAAKAIAAKAAIAVVRLMIFLPQIEIARPPRSALTGLVRAHGPAAAGDGRLRAKSLTAAGAAISDPARSVSIYSAKPHRQALIGRDSGLDLSTCSTGANVNGRASPVVRRKSRPS